MGPFPAFSSWWKMRRLKTKESRDICKADSCKCLRVFALLLGKRKEIMLEGSFACGEWRERTESPPHHSSNSNRLSDVVCMWRERKQAKKQGLAIERQDLTESISTNFLFSRNHHIVLGNAPPQSRDIESTIFLLFSTSIIPCSCFPGTLIITFYLGTSNERSLRNI